MGLVFVILFWLLLAGIYGAITLFFCGLFLLGWLKRWKWLRWTAGVPAAGLVVLGVTLPVAMVIGMIWASTPKSVFASTFHEPPSSEISDLKSSIWWFADSGSVYLRFHTTEAEFKRLLPTALAPCTSEQLTDGLLFDAPSWWTFKINPKWIYFQRVTSIHPDLGLSKKGFSSEWEYYAFDPETKTAYYQFQGID